MPTTYTHSHLLRVFEYQTIRIGDVVENCVFSKQHFYALARFYEKHGGKYYSLLHNGVKFSHYVGAIQIGQLTIEILPKADKKERPDASYWHDVLIDMLRECRLLKVETLASAKLQLRTNAILELYFEIFLKEVERLLRRGLFRSYQMKEQNEKYFKGKLIFHKHIQYNLAHKERFYIRSQKFDHGHLLNRILRRALDILETLVFSPTLLFRIKRIKEHFPAPCKTPFTERHFQKLMHDRKVQPYHTALEIARLLVLNYSPDLRGGKHHLLAILFDMNLLFEEYVYKQLKRLESDELTVKRQQQKPFWQRRKIQPDILLTYQGENFVLDTKWKVLKTVSPSMEDLKQMYVYNQYFEARHSVLLYPKVYDLNDLKPTPYVQNGEEQNPFYCQIQFLEILSNQKLNKSLGLSILEKLLLEELVGT